MRLRDLLQMRVTAEVRPGVWVSARPLVGPFVWRLRDAWAVLTGRADALFWPSEDDPTTWCAIDCRDGVLSVGARTPQRERP